MHHQSNHLPLTITIISSETKHYKAIAFCQPTNHIAVCRVRFQYNENVPPQHPKQHPRNESCFIAVIVFVVVSCCLSLSIC